MYVQLIQLGIPGINSYDSMDKALTQIEEKIDLLIREVITLKKRLDSLSHQPRDKPLPIVSAAEYLNLSVSRIYGLIYSGLLKPIQRGKKGRILFSLEELNRYLNDKTNNNYKTN